MYEDILNSAQVGYKYLSCVGSSFIASYSMWKGEGVQIREVKIIKDNTKRTRSEMARIGGGVIGAVVGGVIGAAIMLGLPNTEWDVSLDVYLTNGKVLELRVKTEEAIKKLWPYVKQPDPRGR